MGGRRPLFLHRAHRAEEEETPKKETLGGFSLSPPSGKRPLTSEATGEKEGEAKTELEEREGGEGGGIYPPATTKRTENSASIFPFSFFLSRKLVGGRKRSHRGGRRGRDSGGGSAKEEDRKISCAGRERGRKGGGRGEETVSGLLVRGKFALSPPSPFYGSGGGNGRRKITELKCEEVALGRCGKKKGGKREEGRKKFFILWRLRR